MALTARDRETLASSWRTFDPETFVGGAPTPAGAANSSAPMGAIPSPEDVAEDVARWIDSLNVLPPDQRLLELEKALEQEDDEMVARQLQKAISTVLSTNKMLAAKVALFRYAYEHPVLAIAGVVGLLATVVMIGKGVVFRIF